MPTPRQFAGIVSLTLLAVAAYGSGASAINIKIDYSKDTSGFFGAGNPQGATGGAQAKAAIEAAATFYSGILKDTFSTFEIPEEFNGSLGGQAKWFWKQRVLNPTSGLNEAVLNAPAVAANDFVVYVGARNLVGVELGRAGPGGFVGGRSTRSGAFTTEENAQLDATEAAFLSGTKRGQSSGFSSWGGSAAFDIDTTWHFNPTTNPPAGTNDFYTVAIHELGHVLGLGSSDAWNALVDGTNFKGSNAMAQFTQAGTTRVPLASAGDTGHWLQTITESPVYEDAGTQLPIMVPETSAPGTTRRLLTNLDAAALTDIGWEIDLPGGASASSLVSNLSSSGSQQFSSFAMSAVPEPTSAVLWTIAAAFLSCFKSRARRRN